MMKAHEGSIYQKRPLPSTVLHCSDCDVRWYGDRNDPCWYCGGPGRPLTMLDSYIRLPSYYTTYCVPEGHMDPYLDAPPQRKEQA